MLVATIDMAGHTMNVFSAELMDTLMDRVDSDPAVPSCVITSGNASFLAGADLAMVRTLVLERLRTERELIAPAKMKLERLAVGQLGSAWIDALSKVKLPQAADPLLPADTIELFDVHGGRHKIRVHTLADVADGPCAVLPSPGPYGRVMEIVGADNGTAAALAALAARMGTVAWRTPGPRSVLQQLHGLTLEQQVPIATACAAGHGAGDLAFLDVATCLAGATPAWSGGPLTWQRAQNA